MRAAVGARRPGAVAPAASRCPRCPPALAPRPARLARPRAAPRPFEEPVESGVPQPGLAESLRRLAARAGAAALAAALLATSSPALADDPGGVVLRLPASEDPEIYQVQQTLFEAWSIVGDSFVDETFNGTYWPDALKAHMLAAYAAPNGPAAFAEIGAMLDQLGDPYTRVIPPSEYADFRVSSDGELQGVGLLIANEPVHNHLLVLSAIKGGPADRAGITSGDEVISINDQPTDGWTGDMAAHILRGKGGTEVRVKFARRTDGIPGVPGRPEPPLADAATVREVRLRRERLALSPLYYTALNAPELVDGGSGARGARGLTLAAAPAAPAPAAPRAPAGAALPGGGAAAAGPVSAERLGYLRLTSFSQNAADDMARAIRELEAQGVAGYILDLRDNPGGLVKSGIDIARLLLDGHPTLFAISGRDGEPVQQVTLGQDGDPGSPAASSALTRRPLAVLVNGRSASASEILSGALHDNGRATLVGDGRTYGKGRIQSVYELRDGSALFVTVAKYVTPDGTVIDHAGLEPDAACGPTPGAARRGGPRGASAASAASAAAAQGDDPLAGLSAFLPGMPVGVGGESALADALEHDRCVLTAARLLHDKAAVVAATAKLAAALPSSSSF
ncbi:CTPA3 [Scenedesmus sp. PABB004]|nr:CTPA3 [Scenedesmus sp. PABB004]